MRPEGSFSARSGQALVETVLAVLFITFLFLAAFQLSHWLTARILASHAAARVARARAVGFNDFMCLKAARVAVIPVAGRRLWPTDEEIDELSRVPIYLCTDSEGVARGVLEYEHWRDLEVSISTGVDESSATVSVPVPRFLPGRESLAEMKGRAAVESHFPLYLKGGF